MNMFFITSDMLTERLTLALARHAFVLHLRGPVTSCYTHICLEVLNGAHIYDKMKELW